MRPIGTYSVEPAPDGADGARCYLLKDGVRAGPILPGRDLEAQFAAAGGDLLFFTHDLPYEECLEIVLFGPGGDILDTASVWGSLTTGVFRDAIVSGPDSVTFAFFGGSPWRLTVWSAPRFRPPLWDREPLGVHRRFGWTRRFAIRRENSPRNRNAPSRSD